MRRFADIFIAICIPIVAASAGAVAYWQFEATGRMAIAFAFVMLVLLVLVRLDALGRRARRESNERMTALGRQFADLSGDLDAFERRLVALEDGGVGRRHREEVDQVVAEVEVIGTLTRQVIEAVADLEVQFAETRTALIRGEAATVAASAQPPAKGGERATAAGGRARSPLVPEQFAHLDEDAFLAVVRKAIDADRVDVHLQPIVTLPQRKVRFYEALTRLRSGEGDVIHPSDYIPIAENRGYMAMIDEQILLKSMTILRRLSERSREVGVFLNLSAASLGHGSFFRDFLQYMEKNRDLADMLVLEFPQGAVRTMGPIEHEGLKALYELGFRFSVDQISDLKISFQNLSDRGFKYVKISAERLLHRADELGTDIHPIDLTDYFRRFGMELIADHIERESDVVDVLDFGVRLGQGFLFAPPRQVRVDVGATDRARSLAASVAATSATAAAAETRAPAGRTAPKTEARAGEARAGGAKTGPGPAPVPPPVARAATAKAAAEPEARPGIRIVPGTGTGTGTGTRTR